MLAASPVHAIVPTHDLSQARPFYEDTLGLRTLEERPDNSIVLEAGAGTLLLLYQTQVDVPAAHTVCAFRVEDVAARVAELEARGVSFQEYDLSEYGFDQAGGKQKVMELPDGRKGAFFTDPEGNIIGIFS